MRPKVGRKRVFERQFGLTMGQNTTFDPLLAPLYNNNIHKGPLLTHLSGGFQFSYEGSTVGCPARHSFFLRFSCPADVIAAIDDAGSEVIQSIAFRREACEGCDCCTQAPEVHGLTTNEIRLHEQAAGAGSIQFIHFSLSTPIRLSRSQSPHGVSADTPAKSQPIEFTDEMLTIRSVVCSHRQVVGLDVAAIWASMGMSKDGHQTFPALRGARWGGRGKWKNEPIVVGVSEDWIGRS